MAVTVLANQVDATGGVTVQSEIDTMKAQIAALQSGGGGGGGSSLAKFQVDVDTVAIWNFDDDLTEAGTGNPNLTLIKELGAAAPEFVELAPGYKGLHIYPGQRYGLSLANSAVMDITGDMTGIITMRMDTAPGSNLFLFAFGGSTESPDENMKYELMFHDAEPGFPLQFKYFHEHGNGVNDGATDAAAVIPAVGTMVQIGYTRINNEIQLYMDGQKVGPLITGLATMTGGEVGRFVVGALTLSTSPCHWVCGGIKICDRGLSDSEMSAQYVATIG
jgi:hypothetical protein